MTVSAVFMVGAGGGAVGGAVVQRCSGVWRCSWCVVVHGSSSWHMDRGSGFFLLNYLTLEMKEMSNGFLGGKKKKMWMAEMLLTFDTFFKKK